MALDVLLRIGNREIGSAHIVNRGHPSDGDHPDYDDLRLYTAVIVREGKITDDFEVQHHRNDGAWKLVHLVSAKTQQRQRRRMLAERKKYEQ